MIHLSDWSPFVDLDRLLLDVPFVSNFLKLVATCISALFRSQPEIENQLRFPNSLRLARLVDFSAFFLRLNRLSPVIMTIS